MITFCPLSEHDFPLLLQWLEKDHVKAGWPEDEAWTCERIREKYDSYIQGYKRDAEGKPKPLQAYIIYEGEKPIGYIQAYDVRDFPREEDGEELPHSCAAIDMYIGESDDVGKGKGPQALDAFVKEYIFPHFNAAFVDPDPSNTRAIRAYEKAGFQEIAASLKEVRMIRQNKAKKCSALKLVKPGEIWNMDRINKPLLPLKPFYFIRHGETEWNKQTIVMGSRDIPLNATGIKQAQDAANFLEREEFKVVISSPKLRAKQTAEIIASQTKHTLLFDEGLVERLWGEAEGKPDDPTKSFYEDADTPQGAESFSTFQKRVVEAVSAILMKHDSPLLRVPRWCL